MQHKIKLLYDMEQLSVSRGKGTGIVRVADILLKSLQQSEQIDVYPLVTTNRGNVSEYLHNAGLDVLQNKVVVMPKLRKTCKKDNWYKKAIAKFLSGFYGLTYRRRLAGFDAYLSLFSPISPIVYCSGVKTFAFVHDLIPIIKPEYCGTKFAEKYKQWIKDLNADVILTISESTKNDLLTFRPDIQSDKIKVVYLGADSVFAPVNDEVETAAVRKKYGIQTKKYLLAVSEVSLRKNFEHLLEAFTVLMDKAPDKQISLVLAGPVREGFSAVADKISRLEKYRDKIVQTGFVAEEDMPALYSGATAFVYPSLYEGFGLPILEAMQCAAPVVCADNSSLPEVGGGAACYISGRDVAETAAVLEKICFDQDLRQRLSQKSLKQAQKFSWNKFKINVTKIMLEKNDG